MRLPAQGKGLEGLGFRIHAVTRSVGMAMHFREAPVDGPQQEVSADGLLQEGGRAGSNRARFVRGAIASGQDDDGDAGEFGDQLQPIHNHETIAGGKAEVEQDEIGMKLAGLGDAGHGVGRVVGFVVARAQPAPDTVVDIEVVFNQQNACRVHEFSAESRDGTRKLGIPYRVHRQNFLGSQFWRAWRKTGAIVGEQKAKYNASCCAN